MILMLWTICTGYPVYQQHAHLMHPGWFFRVVSMKMCLSQVRHDDVWDKQYISLLIYHKHQPFMQAKIYHTPGDSIRDPTWFPNLNENCGIFWSNIRILVVFVQQKHTLVTLGGIRLDVATHSLLLSCRNISSDTVDPAPIWFTKRGLYIH